MMTQDRRTNGGYERGLLADRFEKNAGNATTPPDSSSDALFANGGEAPGDVILRDGFNEVAPPNPDPRNRGRVSAPAAASVPQSNFGETMSQFFELLMLLLSGNLDEFSRKIDWYFPEDQYSDPVEREQRIEHLQEVVTNRDHPDWGLTPSEFIKSNFGENANIRAILDHIAKHEAVGGSYNSVFPAKTIPGLSDMTINEVIAWQREYGPKHGSSAAGRYQFMPNTLEGLKNDLNLTGNEKFSPEMQDTLAIQLMREKGLDSLLKGNGNARDFVDGLSEIWQALQDSSGRGRIDNDLGKASVGPAETIRLAEALKPKGPG